MCLSEADLNFEFTLPTWVTAVVEHAVTEARAKLAYFYKNSGEKIVNVVEKDLSILAQINP